MAHDVFISYSNKDKLVADGICVNLEAAGIRCWIAPRDIAPGEDWPTAITKAISQSSIMVLVFSSNSNSSKDVGRELMLATNSKMVIIPFKIENIEPEPRIDYFLAGTHWLDAINPPTQEQIRTLIECVKVVISARENPIIGEQPVITPQVVQSAPVSVPAKPPLPKPAPRKETNWVRYLWIPVALAVLCIVATIALGVLLPVLTRATATETPTATATLTPTPIFTSTPTFTPTSTPLPDISGAVLTLDDLTAGFEILHPEDFGLSPEKIGTADMPVGSTFGFEDSTNVEFVFGFNFLLISPTSKANFDVMVNNPEMMGAAFTSSFDPNSIISQDILTGLENIGEQASGVTMLINYQGIHFRMDLIIFQRDFVGSMLLVMYIDGATPPMLSADIARIWDAKIEQSLGK